MHSTDSLWFALLCVIGVKNVTKCEVFFLPEAARWLASQMSGKRRIETIWGKGRHF